MNPFLNEDLQEISQYLEENDFGGKTFLVTGATGLLGSLLIKSFIYFNQRATERIHYVAVARSARKAKEIFQDAFCEENFLFQEITDRIPEGVFCDYVIHTACPTVSSYMVSNPVETAVAITDGTKQILEYAKRTNASGMVYLSSMEAFGQCESRQERRTEQELGYVDLTSVRSCYPEAKRMAECLCNCYAQEYGVKVKIARLAQVFGAGVLPGENRVFAQFARSASRGENLVLHTTGESVGNYCYTKDAICAILLLCKKGESGQAYTVVNEQMTMAIKDMAETVASKLSEGRSRVIFDIPESNRYGYAPQTKMRLSGVKLQALGWKATVGMEEAYKRMLPSLK